jgi:hypothetical protein
MNIYYGSEFGEFVVNYEEGRERVESRNSKLLSLLCQHTVLNLFL